MVLHILLALFPLLLIFLIFIPLIKAIGNDSLPKLRIFRISGTKNKQNTLKHEEADLKALCLAKKIFPTFGILPDSYNLIRCHIEFQKSGKYITVEASVYNFTILKAISLSSIVFRSGYNNYSAIL